VGSARDLEVVVQALPDTDLPGTLSASFSANVLTSAGVQPSCSVISFAAGPDGGSAMPLARRAVDGGVGLKVMTSPSRA
jgi:hypothetical protein